VLGAHDAQLTLVQYGDFECPYCREAAPVVKLLMTSHAGQMRYAFRHYPLEEVHPHALLAAQAAEAAGAQGKFWPMHDLLFADASHLRRPSLLARAERLELDMTRFTAELDDEVYLQRVREHIEGGRASGVRATPTFFLDGALVDVSFGLRALSDEVARALRSPAAPAR
jgi:protein-disulfide isomerase